MCSPISSASCCNSTFHRRQRLPMDPPPSAVISNRLARGVDLAPHVPPPPPHRLDRKRGRVMIAPHADPAGVGRFVVDAIRDDLAQPLMGKVVDLDLVGLSLRVPCAPT